MKLRRIFITILQVLGYFAAVFVVLALEVIPTKIIFGGADIDSIESRTQILILGVHLVVAVALTNIVISRVGRSRLVNEGWPGFRKGLQWFGVGSLAGLSMAGGVMLILLIFGGGHVTLDKSGTLNYIIYVLPLVAYLLIAALGEEWIFRGYPLSKFSQVIGRGWANFLVALLFSASHWGGNGWNALTAVNILMFSMVNGAIRFTPGGIPAAWGFHFAWNSLYVLSGATLTGDSFEVPLVNFASSGPGWLSGGAFGPEGSLGTTLVTIIGLLLISRSVKKKMTGGVNNEIRKKDYTTRTQESEVS